MRFSVGPPLIMTSNVILYTKFDIVVANRRFFEGLTDKQRSVVREAVAARRPRRLPLGRPRRTPSRRGVRSRATSRWWHAI